MLFRSILNKLVIVMRTFGRKVQASSIFLILYSLSLLLIPTCTVNKVDLKFLWNRHLRFLEVYDSVSQRNVECINSNSTMTLCAAIGGKRKMNWEDGWQWNGLRSNNDLALWVWERAIFDYETYQRPEIVKVYCTFFKWNIYVSIICWHRWPNSQCRN